MSSYYYFCLHLLRSYRIPWFKKLLYRIGMNNNYRISRQHMWKGWSKYKNVSKFDSKIKVFSLWNSGSSDDGLQRLTSWILSFCPSRGSWSLKTLTSRKRRTCRTTWTEWSLTPGSWSWRSRTTQTRVSRNYTHCSSPHTFMLFPFSTSCWC